MCSGLVSAVREKKLDSWIFKLADQRDTPVYLFRFSVRIDVTDNVGVNAHRCGFPFHVVAIPSCCWVCGPEHGFSISGNNKELVALFRHESV